MIGLLVYGALWLLTLNVGGLELARAYAEFYRGDSVEFTQKSAIPLTITAVRRNDELFDPLQELTGKVHSPAPFVLIWAWERTDLVPGVNQRSSGFHGVSTVEKDIPYLWYPGRKIPIVTPPTFRRELKFE